MTEQLANMVLLHQNTHPQQSWQVVAAVVVLLLFLALLDIFVKCSLLNIFFLSPDPLDF